ncbi:MAG: M14 family zinc carboxypeptidase [Tunicatimonas sp.]|uniref:M14 family zinc carboxypeptidase n=1 Tax=Tunicatimonas sp. TaxID=1940096 RepID=UPI003C7286A8
MKAYLSSLFVFLATFSFAQPALVDTERYPLDPDLLYNEAIPTPASHLSYELGAEFTIYHQVVNYLRTLAEASPRIRLDEYGTTYEGRPLIYLVISSEENQQNLEEIRLNNLKLANTTELSSSEAESLITSQPVITSMSYNIHGNEASSTEAAMQVAYRLAAAQDDETLDILNNSVIIMYPCINPDGRDRYVYWYNSMQRNLLATEPNDIEHDAPFPNGRTNHYWFDLNRDWIWLLHPESRGHIGVYQQWMPQVHVDYHEQGYNNNYFTAPGTTPRNLTLPDRYEALSDTFGMANVRAFDQNQISYFTREAFDFFYPGYGSSYPTVMGAIGMLVEQGGIGGGRAIETDDDFVLTLRNRLFDHYTTSFATFKKAAEKKVELRRYFYEALQPATSKVSTQAYILPDDSSGYLNDVVNILVKHGVSVERANQGFSVRDALNYRSGNPSERQFRSGDIIVSADQPRHLFINSILQPQLDIEDSVMYDMATWSAPLAYNLEAFATDRSVNVSSELISETSAPPSGVSNPEATYAFAIEWKQPNAPRALSMLWNKKYQVRSALKPFRSASQSFGRGSLVVLLGRNEKTDEEVQQDMQQIADSAQVKIVGLNSGRMTDGIDLSSRYSRPLKAPKAAMLVDQPFSVYSSGQLWFLFDQVSHFPITRIRASSLQQTSLPKLGRRYGYADLNSFDVLLLPGTSNLKEVFNKSALANLKSWVNSGGTLIATEECVAYLAEGDSSFTGIETLKVPEDSSQTAKYLTYAEREDYYGWKRTPGSALNSTIDNSHPLAFGMPEQLYSLKFGNDALAANTKMQAVGYYEENADELLASGYVARENREHLAGNVFAGVVPMGKGKVVLFTDNTQYRMFWRGPSRMMQNAVMLLPSL